MLSAIPSLSISGLSEYHGLSDFHVHNFTIGPQDEQGLPSQLFACDNLSAAACLAGAAAHCESLGWCRSFAALDGAGEHHPVQLYHADWNASLVGHPRWTLYALGTQPPPPPPPPPSPVISYCALKGLVQEYAAQLMPQSAMAADAVYQALQLGPLCGQPPPSERRPGQQQHQQQHQHQHQQTTTTAAAATTKTTTTTPATSVFVDAAQGSDSADGGADAPVRTLARALALTRQRAPPSARAASSPALITLAGGTYYLGATLQLGAADSNLRVGAAPDAARAAGAGAVAAGGGGGGAPAVISGGAPLPSDLTWLPVETAAPDVHLSSSRSSSSSSSSGGSGSGSSSGSGSGVFVTTLPAAAADGSELPADFDTLFVGGRRATRARFPNANAETQGLQDVDSGYLPHTAAAVVGRLIAQSCARARACTGANETVPGFVYGHYSGAEDLTAGYYRSGAPFEPYWCGKWSGLRGLALNTAGNAFANSSLARWNASRLADGRAVLHMTRGTSDIWSNFQWRIDNYTAAAAAVGGGANATTATAGAGAGEQQKQQQQQQQQQQHLLSLGEGGYQFPRGTSSVGWFWLDNILEELDAANEWYFEPRTRRLFFKPNATDPAYAAAAAAAAAAGAPPPMPPMVVARLRTLISAAGDGDGSSSGGSGGSGGGDGGGGGGGARIENVSVVGCHLSHTATTYLQPYETPSGGGYSVHRGAAVAFANASGVAVRGCTFDSPGGNGLLLSEHVRGAVVDGCDFKWVGDSAIVLLGRTALCDATRGTQPRGTTVTGNLLRELGIWGKQGAGLFQALAMATTVERNLIFNGPRAGILFNDGMGGAHLVRNNVLFNLVRETTDHGPFNSWDRTPYVTERAVDEGGPGAAAAPTRVGPALSNITRNMVMCNYQCTWPIDHDDGSNAYNDTYNVLMYGGAKNFLGHDKTSMNNLYILPDDKPTEGPFGQGNHKPFCANNDGAVANSSGFRETWANNRCILARPASTYAYDNCDSSSAAALAATSDHTFGNTFYLSDTGALSFKCGHATWDLAKAQQMGWDAGSVAAPLPTADEIVAWSKEILSML